MYSGNSWSLFAIAVNIYWLIFNKILFMFANRNRGFTLIELLVVIAIIGILSSVVLASLNSARKKSRDARRIGDVKQVQLALEMFYDTNTAYPTDAQGLAQLATDGFIPAVPADPTNSGVYVYSYDASASADSYTLRAVLENDHKALASDIDGAFDADADGCDDPDSAGSENYCIQP